MGRGSVGIRGPRLHNGCMKARNGRGRGLAKTLLGGALVFAGIAHLTFARRDFQAQVPDFVPLEPDTTVVASGIAEITLGTALAVSQGKRAGTVGRIAAVFFAAVFPGNVSQYTQRRSAFGLDTDRKRFARLFFQPVLIVAALWSTRA
ncbi:membrane protein [Microbacterium nanhaiense]|uniref:Membrane protein n=2 Tax=Microbacterium nanhaiense TaxID=1301026 RepID=A0ABQ2MYN8_9MICO|nr:membrane protein [Microbacterium nanhaiense]